METLQKEEVVQAVLIADNYNNHFQPITRDGNASLLPLVNTPMIDYALEALNKSQVEEVFLFCTSSVDDVKAHIAKRIEERCSWSVKMTVQIVGSDGCYCLGDALRDLYAKRLIRGHFILLSTDTVTNANLHTILEGHKKQCALDEGTAMTVVFKKKSPGLQNGEEMIVVNDARSKRLLFHQRLDTTRKSPDQGHCTLPLEIFIDHSDVEIRNDLSDPQIAICAPVVLALFADNFDFETRDDFIRGLLINEEILASTIYFAELHGGQYASKVRNWQMYQIVSNDIINRWAYPLVPDMGICSLKQNYIFLRNNVYRNKTVQLASNVNLKENVVVQENCSIGEGTTLINSVVGKNCIIGRNCVLEKAYIFDNVKIGDNCVIRYGVVGNGTELHKGVVIRNGSVVGSDCVIQEKISVDKQFVVSTDEETDDDQHYVKLGDRAYILQQNTAVHPTVNDPADSDEEDDLVTWDNLYMSQLNYNYESSVCSSSTDDLESNRLSPVPEDANIFLAEVIDSLERGFREKSNPDFLILEINSSRYAYNMVLPEVNFYVVQAFLNLYPIKESNGNVLSAFNQIYGHLSPVLKNYIRGADAMSDCLKAIEECCHQNELLKSKLAQIIHFLYDKEILTEDSILQWHENLDDDKDWIKTALIKLITWLNESSEGESSDEEDD